MNRLGASFCLKAAFFACLASAGGLGCGGNANAPAVTPSTTNLSIIGSAYARATLALDRGPQNKDELMPYLQQEPDPDDPDKPARKIDMAELFRSPNDSQDYVIFWGVDYRDYPGRRRAPVIAYEKEGKDGQRVVLQGKWAHTVSDEQLAELPFPMGFSPP